MVTFARAKAKSIFSKLRLTSISKTRIQTHTMGKKEKLSFEKEKSSNPFFDAIKSGGVWLS
tara:strand:- start:367 stop:549 length:183 start_codon:yes stop_codon:yes gene_type:complete